MTYIEMDRSAIQMTFERIGRRNCPVTYIGMCGRSVQVTSCKGGGLECSSSDACNVRAILEMAFV